MENLSQTLINGYPILPEVVDRYYSHVDKPLNLSLTEKIMISFMGFGIVGFVYAVYYFAINIF